VAEGFCVKERKRVEVKDPEEVVTKNGRRALRGTCPDCGAKIFRFLSANEVVEPAGGVAAAEADGPAPTEAPTEPAKEKAPAEAVPDPAQEPEPPGSGDPARLALSTAGPPVSSEEDDSRHVTIVLVAIAAAVLALVLARRRR
jgi:MYXO-CTERM domain-containing protein